MSKSFQNFQIFQRSKLKRSDPKVKIILQNNLMCFRLFLRKFHFWPVSKLSIIVFGQFYFYVVIFLFKVQYLLNYLFFLSSKFQSHTPNHSLVLFFCVCLRNDWVCVIETLNFTGCSCSLVLECFRSYRVSAMEEWLRVDVGHLVKTVGVC